MLALLRAGDHGIFELLRFDSGMRRSEPEIGLAEAVLGDMVQ